MQDTSIMYENDNKNNIWGMVKEKKEISRMNEFYTFIETYLVSNIM